MSKPFTLELNPTILIEPGTHRVTWVSLAGQVPEPYQRLVEQAGYKILQGHPAHWLYIALAGHRMNELPNQASPIYARAARAYIQLMQINLNKPRPDLRPRAAAYHLARLVLNQWGHHIRPWLGMHLYNPRTGQALTDAPEHHLLIDLISGQRIAPQDQHYTLPGRSQR